MRFATLSICVVLLLQTASGLASDYPVRTWTNDKGETLEASLKSLSGSNATLEANGEYIRAPINRLSDADKEWIKQLRTIQRWREWTLADGSTQRAKLESYDGTKMILRTRDSESELEWTLDNISDVDRELVSAVYESQATDDTEDGTNENEGTEELRNVGTSRSWTDISGKTILAEFRGIEDDKVVLFFKEREWRVPVTKFSARDQQWVASCQEPLVSEPDPTTIASNTPRGGMVPIGVTSSNRFPTQTHNNPMRPDNNRMASLPRPSTTTTPPVTQARITPTQSQFPTYKPPEIKVPRTHTSPSLPSSSVSNNIKRAKSNIPSYTSSASSSDSSSGPSIRVRGRGVALIVKGVLVFFGLLGAAAKFIFRGGG